MLGCGSVAQCTIPLLISDLGIDPDNMPAAPTRHYDSNQSFAAKRWTDVWAAGQGLGCIHAVEPVQTVVDGLHRDYVAALARLRQRAP